MRIALTLALTVLAFAACSKQPASEPPRPKQAPYSAPILEDPTSDMDEGAPPPAPPRAWPGIATDLTASAPIATARVTKPTALMRKPVDAPDSYWPLRPGHVVLVMAREGPPLADGTGTVPVRFAGLHGWVRSDAIADLPPGRPAPLPDALWAALAAAVGPDVPASCPAGVLLADLDGAPGDEAVVHGIGPERCQRMLGVLTLTDPPRVLGWLAGDRLERIEARALASGPVFLETATFWQRDVRWTGSTLALWLLPPSPGPLVAALSVVDRAVDARSAPTRYEMGRISWPPDPENPTRWLVHRRLTTRTTTGDQEHDEVTEEVLRWSERFVPIAPPSGLPPMPPEPPSIVRGGAAKPGP